MVMSDRQVAKEILRIKKDIDLTESQLQSGMKSKADKEQENIRLEEDIKAQEKENERLAGELEKQETSITTLDEEFKDNQLKAGRIRKEMNMVKEDIEKKRLQEKDKRAQIETLINQIEDARKKVKEEKRSKEQTEYNLRKTNAKLAEIQAHWAAGFVTSKIAKEAKKAGRTSDEIIRSKDAIEEYEKAAKESQLAQVGKSEEVQVAVEIESEAKPATIAPKAEEKKDTEGGLDLDF
jgi:hypothetical protein